MRLSTFTNYPSLHHQAYSRGIKGFELDLHDVPLDIPSPDLTHQLCSTNDVPLLLFIVNRPLKHASLSLSFLLLVLEFFLHRVLGLRSLFKPVKGSCHALVLFKAELDESVVLGRIRCIGVLALLDAVIVDASIVVVFPFSVPDFWVDLEDFVDRGLGAGDVDQAVERWHAETMWLR
ncbi:uncharacterized protein K460DRAFT_59587 [Cucurbitaria berberidis CBS 394.84]|uniref:Uncharacterized protein n=1 Tax=Cucurbitaria berberidis CBS 394.84 TaxID=1168544 RepID=A0A9P4GKZ0_9PLEO|nr:uncharacterized protein K460DRAFT_59587 [Cucurbitaria berberidis CBS 394.84]KAF1847515.1 hypothetical protein K460DRAFT_59587 [Cucurbitaria berberidis CBS 394.84]